MWFRNVTTKILILLAVFLCACTWVAAAGIMVFRQSVSAASSPLANVVRRPVEGSRDALLAPAVDSVVDPAPSVPAPRSELPALGPAQPAPPTPPADVIAPATPAPPVPTAAPAAPSPTPPPRPKTFNILLLGSDRNQPGKGTWRTDVMALVMIEPESRVTGVLALPRDLYVDIPGHEPGRINTVDYLGEYTKYPGGGSALLNQTLRENFGFGFDRFIRIDFAGFVDVVDTLGGIDVDVDCPLQEVFADPAYPQGRLLQLDAGPHHLDGMTALLYVRQRHDNGDTDRSRRQFKVLMGLREKALTLDTLPLIPKLFTSYRTTVQTDLSLLESLELGRWFYDWKSENIRGRIVDQTMASPWTTSKGAWVLLPDRAKVRQAYESLLSGPRLIDAGTRLGRCAKIEVTSGG